MSKTQEIRERLEGLAKLKAISYCIPEDETVEWQAAVIIREQELKVDRLEAALLPSRWTTEMQIAWDFYMRKLNLPAAMIAIHNLSLRTKDSGIWRKQRYTKKVFLKRLEAISGD